MVEICDLLLTICQLRVRADQLIRRVDWRHAVRLGLSDRRWNGRLLGYPDEQHDQECRHIPLTRAVPCLKTKPRFPPLWQASGDLKVFEPERL